jgi:biotin transport system permease protein
MISLMRPGASPLHRLPAGRKLVALIILISAISIIGSNPIGAVAGFAVALSLYLVAFPKRSSGAENGVTLFAKQLWTLKWLMALIIIPQLVFGALWDTVLTNALRLTDAFLIATIFTLTTKHDALMSVIERGSKPLKRLGIKPETVSLTLAMTINAIPMIAKFLAQTKEAQHARGIKPSAVLLTVPLLVASLKYADEYAEALTARGVEV